MTIDGDIIDEPDLQFGNGTHLDIRYGIRNFGPADLNSPLKVTQIKVGLIGTKETILGASKWIENAKNEIKPPDSKNPKIYPPFPGFNEDDGFRASIIMEPSLNAEIRGRDFQAIRAGSDHNGRTARAAELFTNQIARLAIKRPDVIICILPPELLEVIDDCEEEDFETASSIERKYNLHDLMKAASLRYNCPIQILRPGTYDRKLKKQETDDYGKRRQLQEESVIAWNFFTALYYKAGGFPWRLPRDPAALQACYLGVGFFETLEGEEIHSSIAQIFDERGHGLIVHGGRAARDKQDRQIHMDQTAMRSLVVDALNTYKQEHKHLPARLVVHKTSSFNNLEISGAKEAVDDLGIEIIDLVSIAKSSVRIVRDGYYPVLRGSWFNLTKTSALIHTNGAVPFYEDYPGMYVPRGLEVSFDSIESSREEILREILALTKMNWNNAQITSAEPITIRAARQVGTIMRYVQNDDSHAAYRFFM